MHTMEKQSIYQRLAAARKHIRQQKLVKEGKNTFSNYDYFTPEQVAKLVTEACEHAGLTTLFSMYRDELGIRGVLKLINLEGEGEVEVTTPTSIPEIKATNTAQQLGGAMTYTERYLKMSLFEIADNSLDFDATNKDNSQSSRVNPANNNNSDFITHGDWRKLKNGDNLMIGGTHYIFKNGKKADGTKWAKLEDPNQKDKKNPKYNVSYWSTSDIFQQLLDQWSEEISSTGVDPDSIPETFPEFN